MRFFLLQLSAAFVAALLAVTGTGHLFGFRELRRIAAQHRIVPARLVGVAALAVVVAELGAAAAGLAVILRPGGAVLAAALFGTTAALGAVFLSYVRHLLRRRPGARSCGCSPFRSPLTRLSLVPAGSLLAVSGAALPVTVSIALAPVQPPAAPAGPMMAALPLLWGVTAAGLVLLLPAAAAPEERVPA